MKHPKTDAAMQAYVSSCGGDKDRELQKFRDLESPPRPKAAHRYRPLIAAALVLLVIGISVLFLTLPNSLLGIRQTSLVAFPHNSGFIASYPNPQYSKLDSLIGKLPEDAQPFLDILLPQLNCTEIEISRMAEKWGDKRTVGVCVELKPADGTIRHITGYYISNDYSIRELSKYHNFSQQIFWKDHNIYYRINEKSSGATYQLYFQEGNTSCYMEIEAARVQELAVLLKIIF